MNFLQELNESRLYKRLGQLEGRDVNYIAERLFEHLLALQIFANEKPNLAAKYAETIMKQQHFDGFRTSQPDLYNLITLIIKQDQYSHILTTDHKINIPELRLRRNLLAIARQDFNNNDFSYMMMMLQRKFKQLPGQLIELRRQISNWKNLAPGDQKTAVRRLLMQMRERGMQSDFYMHLSRLLD